MNQAEGEEGNHPDEERWNIPERALPFISKRCKNGTYLECKICSLYDSIDTKFGRVMLRHNFWHSYFNNDHLKSKRHMKNVALKAKFIEANERRVQNGEGQKNY